MSDTALATPEVSSSDTIRTTGILPIVQTISNAIADAVHSPDVSARQVQIGARPVGGTPQQMRASIQSTTALWKRVIEVANVHIE
ncbi:MAG: hypothetical protein WA268_26705 [Xanthobacteraceae bacterium]